MKKVTLSILAIALATASWGQLDRSKKPMPGPAPEIKLGKSESFTLPNGLRVFVVENHKVPSISCNIQLDVKPELERDMAGYRDMMPELLLSGTATRPKDKLNAEIDQMGARISVHDEGINGNGLKKYTEKIFDLMADIAMNTIITQAELDRTKKKALSGLETEKNEPDAMVRNVSAVVNFGADHPYGEIATEASIKKITLQRCTNYYKTYFRPNVAYMAIVGDVTMAEIKPIVEKYFGKWQKMDVPVARYTPMSLTAANKMTKVDFAPRTAAVQSVVSVTYPIELKPGGPDVIKAQVANTVLGGGSQGRLFLDLREKHAWTYGAYSSLSVDDLGSSFSATVKCRNAVSDSAVGAILDEMRSLQTERVSDAALQNSITYLSGNFAISLEDPSRIAQFAINTERYHMPADYYQNYLKNLSAVTPDDVMAMANKYIRPDHANIVVAGSKEEVADKLAKYSADGKIDYFDYAGTPMKPVETMAAPAGMTANDVFKKYINALGGEAAINGIKDIRTTATSVMQGAKLTIVEMKKAPNKWRQTVDMAVGGQNMTIQKQVYDGVKAYQEQQHQKADVTGDDLDEMMMGADLTGDLHPEKYGIRRTLKGMETVNGSNAYVVAVAAKGKKWTEYYDAASGLLIKKIQGEGDKTQISEYGDYREVPGTGGYKIAYKIVETQSGQAVSEDVQSVDVNKGIEDSEFN